MPMQYIHFWKVYHRHYKMGLLLSLRVIQEVSDQQQGGDKTYLSEDDHLHADYYIELLIVKFTHHAGNFGT